jgi:PD-(D/E)XK nuclease superfamily
MNTNDEKLLLKDEVFQVVGCAIEVLNTLDHGLVEKPYENAFVVEFLLRKIPFQQSRKLSGLNYLRITSLRVGVILNFKHSKLEWQRIAYKFVSIRVHSPATP